MTPELELIPPEEAKQIEHIIQLTMEQLQRRYPGDTARLRGQHARDHACVTATFTVRDDLPPDMRVGVLATPGQRYQAWVRYSNASSDSKAADSPVIGGTATHGSRGMALKILGVTGSLLLATDGIAAQDFLMVNHPVFPFANVEDYEALSQILAADDKPDRFFAERIHKNADGSPNLTDPVTRRALRTAGIVKRIQSLSPAGQPPAYQAPPVTPLDNQYFGAAPFLFGDGRVMRVTARPVAVVAGEAFDQTDPHYLRTALRKRLTAADAQSALFDFQIQVRSAGDLAGKIETDIEDACVQWDEAMHPFVKVGTIAIPPQDFETSERRALCEGLVFTPWHAIAEHRPLGGINRLRRAVYEASSRFRHAPAQPARS